MASFVGDKVMLKPPDSKMAKSPRAKTSSLKHKTRFPSQTVKQSEESLRQLLDDFEQGRLSAFGNSDMLQKMNNIRDMQERLTMKHFEIDHLKMTPDTASGTGLVEDQEDSYLMELTQALEKLGSTIQSMHCKDSTAKKSGEGHSKKVTLKASFGKESV